MVVLALVIWTIWTFPSWLHHFTFLLTVCIQRAFFTWHSALLYWFFLCLSPYNPVKYVGQVFIEYMKVRRTTFSWEEVKRARRRRWEIVPSSFSPTLSSCSFFLNPFDRDWYHSTLHPLAMVVRHKPVKQSICRSNLLGPVLGAGQPETSVKSELTVEGGRSEKHFDGVPAVC